jgi:hypothetical protein
MTFIDRPRACHNTGLVAHVGAGTSCDVSGPTAKADLTVFGGGSSFHWRRDLMTVDLTLGDRASSGDGLKNGSAFFFRLRSEAMW